MAENLKTTKYNDGTSIPFITDNSTWIGLTTPGYSWLNNDEGFKSTVGGLYNFFISIDGSYSCWWLSNTYSTIYADYFGIVNENGRLQNDGSGAYQFGFPVRCIKN